MSQEFESLSRAEAGALARVENTLDEMRKSISDVRERMARMEALASHNYIDETRKEFFRIWEAIGKLEADKHQRYGQIEAAKTWSEWTHRLAPWAFAIALVVWNYFRPPGN